MKKIKALKNKLKQQITRMVENMAEVYRVSFTSQIKVRFARVWDKRQFQHYYKSGGS